MLKLIQLTKEHEQLHKNFLDEWDESGITPWAAGLHGETFEQWLKTREAFKTKETCPKDKMPDETYFLIDTDDETGKLLGAINIRKELNEYLKQVGGHIGYGVVPSERRKGYAVKMLAMGLKVCKELGIKEVLVTCDEDNVASARTIEKNGGVLLEKVVYEGDPLRKYTIYVK